jgi:hypothetical protein
VIPHQNLKSYGLDYYDKIFVAGFNATVLIVIPKVIQQGTHIDPNTPRYQNTVKTKSKKSTYVIHTTIRSHSLVDHLNQLYHIAGTVNEKTCGHTFPIVGVLVHLQKIASNHVEFPFGWILHWTDIGERNWLQLILTM